MLLSRLLTDFAGPSRGKNARASVYVQVCARYTCTVSTLDYLDVPGLQWSAFQKSRILSRTDPDVGGASSLSATRLAFSASFSLSRLIASFLVLGRSLAVEKSAYDLANHPEYPPLYNTLDRRASDPRWKKDDERCYGRRYVELSM